MPVGSAAVVRANSEAFSRRDVGAMLELFAPDAVVRDRRVVGWGDFLGRDAIRAYYEGLFDNAEEIFEDLAVASASGDGSPRPAPPTPAARARTRAPPRRTPPRSATSASTTPSSPR